jgi:hypothetical protein
MQGFYGSLLPIILVLAACRRNAFYCDRLQKAGSALSPIKSLSMCFMHTFGDFIASALILNFSLGLATNSILRQGPRIGSKLADWLRERNVGSKHVFSSAKG